MRGVTKGRVPIVISHDRDAQGVVRAPDMLRRDIERDSGENFQKKVSSTRKMQELPLWEQPRLIGESGVIARRAGIGAGRDKFRFHRPLSHECIDYGSVVAGNDVDFWLRVVQLT
jgi:hypothetical protein